MIQTSRDGDNSGRVRTHEKNWGETVPPIGHNNTKHLLCPIRSRHLFEFLKIVRWESVPRCSFARSWGNFRPAFSPDPTNCPWVSEDGEAMSCHQMKHREESWNYDAQRSIFGEFRCVECLILLLNQMILEGEIMDAKMSSFSVDFQTLIKH